MTTATTTAKTVRISTGVWEYRGHSIRRESGTRFLNIFRLNADSKWVMTRRGLTGKGITRLDQAREWIDRSWDRNDNSDAPARPQDASESTQAHVDHLRRCFDFSPAWLIRQTHNPNQPEYVIAKHARIPKYVGIFSGVHDVTFWDMFGDGSSRIPADKVETVAPLRDENDYQWATYAIDCAEILKKFRILAAKNLLCLSKVEHAHERLNNCLDKLGA